MEVDWIRSKKVELSSMEISMDANFLRLPCLLPWTLVETSIEVDLLPRKWVEVCMDVNETFM